MSDLAQNPPAVRTVLAGLMLSIFLSALDQTIVAVSLPAISADFADLDLLAWVISAYMVAMTVSMPIYGKLGDLYGRRRLMLFAIVVFTAASLLCGLAQSMGQLVLARVLQGIGAGGLMAVSQAIIGDIVPPRERGRYQGYFSSMYAIASVAGPVLGGLLTEYLSWRWVFWINLPIGLLALAISRRTLVGLPVPRRQPVIDYLGIVLMVVGLTALLLAITQIGQGAQPGATLRCSACSPWRRSPCCCSSPRSGASANRWCRCNCSPSAPPPSVGWLRSSPASRPSR